MSPIVEGLLLEVLKRILTDDVAVQAKAQMEAAVASAKADAMAYLQAQSGKSATKVDDFLVEFLGKVVQ